MTESPQIYTAHDVADVLAASPTFFGFELTESFVVVATHGPRCRFGFRARMDMPEVDEIEGAADLFVTHLRHQGADGAIVLAFTKDRARGRAVVEATRRLLEPDLVPVVLAWADGERYWEPAPHHRVRGRRYELSAHHLSRVQAVAAGQEIVRDRRELVERFAACTGRMRREMLAVSEIESARIVPMLAGTVPRDAVVSAALSEIDEIFDRAVVHGDWMTDREVAVTSVWLSSEAVRDEIWERITTATAEDWWRVLNEMALRVVPPHEPSVLSLAGFAAWMTGNGTQAVIALERSLEADPHHALTRLLLTGLQHGIPPEVVDHWRLERRFSA